MLDREGGGGRKKEKLGAMSSVLHGNVDEGSMVHMGKGSVL